MFPEVEEIERAVEYPRLRWMGGKQRLLPWIHEVLGGLEFETALDAFCGTGAVSWLLKCMGKQVAASDFMRFAATVAEGLVANPGKTLGEEEVAGICSEAEAPADFIRRTFEGIFFTPEDLDFLDRAWPRIDALAPWRRALGLAALGRACLKKQPRGVFTISGDLARYDDGRRDLAMSLEEHFREGVALFNRLVFDDGRSHRAHFGDVFELALPAVDLVYMDPPYVPRSDDNCYIKRYHFVEGLMSYWKAEEARIMETSKVKKLEKRRTPFSFRAKAMDAFDRLFGRFAGSTLVLSYSSNGWPDLEDLVDLMRARKRAVVVHKRPHRYHFGTHGKVDPRRNRVEEYLIVGV